MSSRLSALIGPLVFAGLMGLLFGPAGFVTGFVVGLILLLLAFAVRPPRDDYNPWEPGE